MFDLFWNIHCGDRPCRRAGSPVHVTHISQAVNFDEMVLTVILQGIAYQEAGQLPTTTAAGDFPEPTTFVDP
jgi:hypothetical protein